MPRPKKKGNALQEAYEKEISELLAKPEHDEGTSPELDDELDFDCEHYNRIETTYDD